MVTPGTTLLDKLWDSHEILKQEDGTSLLWVDRHFVHEGSHHAFAQLKSRGLKVAEPSLNYAVTDHYAPTSDRLQIRDATIARMINTLATNAKEHELLLIGLNDSRQGIVHVVGPELGLTTPGLLINCGDSHTSTHGAFGSLAFGIGATEVAHVLATQTLWQKKPKSMRITIDGELGYGVSAKDIALYWIGILGLGGAAQHAVEYAGTTIDALSMDARMTLCNLSIEGGARFGMIAPDATTINYVKGRPYAPKNWQTCEQDWLQLCTDQGSIFDKELKLAAKDIAPIVTWGTSPDQSVSVTDNIPEPDDGNRQEVLASLEYMGLTTGQPLEGLAIDQVFIGSCTNGRLEDLQIAATMIKGKRSKVPGLVSPGSSTIKREAENLGLDQIFTDAGLSWVESGCSSCVGMNGDTVDAGKRCASTTNRNFKGRQGQGARTHLMSPAMVAAAAVHGKIVDVRAL